MALGTASTHRMLHTTSTRFRCVSAIHAPPTRTPVLPARSRVGAGKHRAVVQLAVMSSAHRLTSRDSLGRLGAENRDLKLVARPPHWYQRPAGTTWVPLRQSAATKSSHHRDTRMRVP